MRTSRLRFSHFSVLALAGALAASNVGAASIFEFDGWMSQVEKRALSLQKSLDRRDTDTAIADAREIERLYRRMEEYFTLSGDADSAVDLSKKGWRDALDIAARSATNDSDGARALIKGMMEDCRTCHREYKPLT
jgi:cytochrome c556